MSGKALLPALIRRFHEARLRGGAEVVVPTVSLPDGIAATYAWYRDTH